MRGIASTVLVFEALVIFLATLVALDLNDGDDAIVWSLGGLAAGTFVLVAALLGRRGSYQVGSALQVLVVVAGIFVPAMFILGVIFAGLWFYALHLGRRVAALKAARAEADPPA